MPDTHYPHPARYRPCHSTGHSTAPTILPGGRKDTSMTDTTAVYCDAWALLPAYWFPPHTGCAVARLYLYADTCSLPLRLYAALDSETMHCTNYGAPLPLLIHYRTRYRHAHRAAPLPTSATPPTHTTTRVALPGDTAGDTDIDKRQHLFRHGDNFYRHLPLDRAHLTRTLRACPAPTPHLPSRRALPAATTSLPHSHATSCG